MEQLTSTHQAIYNCWLKHSRTSLGQPFSPRKDFTNVASDVVVTLLKLGLFFNANPAVDIDTFFAAPFRVAAQRQEQVKYTEYPLGFFISYKAMTLYIAYLKMLRASPPDSSEQLKWTADSFRHVALFCIKHQLTLEQYTQAAFTPQCVMHYKDGLISPYCLMSLPGVAHSVLSMDNDVSQLCFGSENMRDYLLKLRTCQRMYSLCENGVLRVKAALATKTKPAQP